MDRRTEASLGGMRKGLEMEKDENQKPKLTLKRRAWLKAYFRTFNATEAARVAGYRCKKPEGFEAIGCQNYRKLLPLIQKWISEVGLTPEKIKLKILAGMEARETQRIKVKGAVRRQDLPEGRRVIATTGVIIYDSEGKPEAGDGDAVIEWEEEALGIQQKYVDMACKVLSLFDGDLLQRVERLEQALEARKRE